MINLDLEAVCRQSIELASQLKADSAFKVQVIGDPLFSQGTRKSEKQSWWPYGLTHR